MPLRPVEFVAPEIPEATVAALVEQEAVATTLTATQQQEVDYIKSFGTLAENVGQAIEVCHQEGMPTLARALALLENESAGRNIFGAEGPAGEGSYQWEGRVTEGAYRLLRELEAETGLLNGVGPCQLTAVQYLEEADRIGGAWRPRFNMAIGFTTLHRLILRTGSVAGGYGAYNGSGPYGAYAQRAIVHAAQWEERLRGHEAK